MFIKHTCFEMQLLFFLFSKYVIFIKCYDMLSLNWHLQAAEISFYSSMSG